ncbi:ketoacyl-ACP synthase III [Flagellimonas flava]|uniref:ketoacyl-ACP synthase III n=1 Tax=Flagellimonas flava TaxID=570519 RepID=UPI003D65961C
MLGIKEIGVYIPSGRISNFERMEELDTNEDFILNKIGISSVAVKANEEDTSDLAIKAFGNLESKIEIDKENVEALILVTQSPDSNIPHTSALVHKALELPETCACFDISLGCSGFVYGLSVIMNFMKGNGMKHGVLLTSDPYTKILDPNDRNTSLLFGDAATATYISDEPELLAGQFNFGSIGKDWEGLHTMNGYLNMNGRSIFNFAARYVPKDVNQLLEKNKMTIEDIDSFVFHQGSKYIVDTISKKLGLPKEKVIFDAMEYGNTVSSSIPLIIEKQLANKEVRTILICGFGVGLSWSSSILKRKN